MELLDKVAALGIEQRKMLREQREMMVLQKEMALSVSELKAGLAELKAGNAELKSLLLQASTRMGVVNAPTLEGVWLDAYEAKELLKIGDLTLRRRRQEGSFIAKKIGKKWFYLRSSLQ